MNEMIEQLRSYGADIDGTMRRFLGDADLYKTCFATFLEDESFKKLGESLAEKDYKKAFEHAHSLKGVAGNMGLTPLYQIIGNIVENLRNEEYSDLQKYYAEMMNQLGMLKKIQF